METQVKQSPLPDHVPPQLVVDFNVYDPAGGKDDLHGTWKALQRKGAILWSPYNGGHWIPTRFEDIDFFQRNHDPFSMKRVSLTSDQRLRLLPLEADPPEHLGFRKIVNPFFMPKRVAALEQGARELAISLIEAVKPDGECEFMSQFAMHLPISIFMKLANLPQADRGKLLEYSEMAHRGDATQSAEAHRLMYGYLEKVVASRKDAPGDDLLSAIVHAQVNGEPIAAHDMMSVLLVVLFGGLDTVASSMGFMAEFLARNPGHRQQLIDNPQQIPQAVNEMMRRFSPSNTARTLTRDYEYKGLQFKEGDKVYVSGLLAGMDDQRFTDAWNIDFSRKEGEHASFGAGPHRCPGQLLALMEMRVFIEEWLGRIPDFHIKPSDPPKYATGQVNCVDRLMLEWTV